jgi:DMSO reductase anchor subunit
MDGTTIPTNASAFTHIMLFLLIVVGGSAVMLQMTETSRSHQNAQDLSRPIPELARWQNETN